MAPGFGSVGKEYNSELSNCTAKYMKMILYLENEMKIQIPVSA